MKKYVWTAIAAALALAMTLPVANAADEAAAAGIQVTLKGVNYNLLGELAADKAADAKPEYATINALKVTEATDAEGNAHEALKGKTIHYLPSKSAEALMAGADNAGKNVTVKGTLFVDANAILVESFEAGEGGGDEWDELDVNSLSGQQVL